jgi:hypothetical protein
MRMTEKKRTLLAYLSPTDQSTYEEQGAPPYSAAQAAKELELDPANTAKTLAAMERDGLVVREVVKKEVWNAIAQQHMPRNCVCYWNAEAIDHDRSRALAYADDRRRRMEAAWSKPSGLFGRPTA